jgi:hypothetical protein
MTHRDPVRMIGSVSSMYEQLYASICPPGAVDNAWIGRRCLDLPALADHRRADNLGGRRGVSRLPRAARTNVWHRHLTQEAPPRVEQPAGRDSAATAAA